MYKSELCFIKNHLVKRQQWCGLTVYTNSGLFGFLMKRFQNKEIIFEARSVNYSKFLRVQRVIPLITMLSNVIWDRNLEQTICAVGFPQMFKDTNPELPV